MIDLLNSTYKLGRLAIIDNAVPKKFSLSDQHSWGKAAHSILRLFFHYQNCSFELVLEFLLGNKDLFPRRLWNISEQYFNCINSKVTLSLRIYSLFISFLNYIPNNIPVTCKEMEEILHHSYIYTLYHSIIIYLNNVLNINHLLFLNFQGNYNLKIKYPCELS